MKDWQNILSEIIAPQKPTYIGLIARVFAIFGFQAFFKLSPFNFQSRPNPSALDLITIMTVIIPTYSLLITYAFQAIIRIGTVAETSDSAGHEKIIAIVCFIVCILGVLYIWFAAPPNRPWYME